jgi:hypothetical protein
MRQFEIEDDVLALILRLAKPEPFESLSSALRRLLTQVQDVPSSVARSLVVEQSLANEARQVMKASADRTRASSPDPQLWVSRVPELRSVPRLNSWQAICDHLGIDVGMDSARRKLREWVNKNRPDWVTVPDA